MLKWLKKLLLKCKLHNIEFQAGTVPIRYGRIVFPQEYEKARKNLFPHANSFVVGGCYMPHEIPPDRKIKYCPLCRQAERKFESRVDSQ